MSDKIAIDVSSEYGRLKGVLLHRPGIEIERMTPSNAAEALYSDILSKHIVDREYAMFSGVFEKWTKVYYVEDLLADLLDEDDIRQRLVVRSCEMEGCPKMADHLMSLESRRLAQFLIEGVEVHPDTEWLAKPGDRFVLKPLYNLFFTRDASSTLYGEVLINTMSFDVRQRETLIYDTIFTHYFDCRTMNASHADKQARTEGGDIQVASPDLLCIGCGIRTNKRGIKFLAEKYAAERPKFRILVQLLPHKPDSFIHLDMVHTFLGQHQDMVYKPMIEKTGLFAGKDTVLIEIDNGKMNFKRFGNILEGLKYCGMEMEPVFCGGSDPWYQDREQWHSGANFFALDDGRVIGYERNVRTIEALSHAGFDVLAAEDVCAGREDPAAHRKCVVVFKASELPRGGGGARCMTMPVCREKAE